MCKVLKISRGSYYKYINKKLSNRELENQKIKKEILKIYQNSKKRYGAPKTNALLKSLGINISLKITQRLMNKLGIKAIVTKKFRPYSNKVNIVERESLVKKNFKTATINEKIGNRHKCAVVKLRRK